MADDDPARYRRRHVFVALLLTTIFAGGVGLLLQGSEPGATAGRWFVGVALMSGPATALALLGRWEVTPYIVSALTGGATAVAVTYVTIGLDVYTGFSRPIALLCVVSAALAIRWLLSARATDD